MKEYKRKSPKRTSRSRRVKRKSPKRKSRSRRVKRKSPVNLNFFRQKKKYYTCDDNPGSRGKCLEFNRESDCEKYKKVGTCSRYRHICENSCIRHILRSDRRKVEEIKSRIKKFDRQKERNINKATREEVSKLRKDIRFLRSKANEQKKMAIEYKKIKDEKNFIKHARIYKKILEKIDIMTKRADSLVL